MDVWHSKNHRINLMVPNGMKISCEGYYIFLAYHYYQLCIKSLYRYCAQKITIRIVCEKPSYTQYLNTKYVTENVSEKNVLFSL